MEAVTEVDQTNSVVSLSAFTPNITGPDEDDMSV